MSKVLVPLVEGFEDIEAVTIVDVLRRGGVEVVTASVAGTPFVKSSHGIQMSADATFAQAAEETYDAIVLPGGPGTGNLKVPAVLERLRRQKEDGRLICASCAAPTVLVEAGVLDPDQHVTCYPTCSLDLDRPSAGVPVVCDGAFHAYVFPVGAARTWRGRVHHFRFDPVDVKDAQVVIASIRLEGEAE